MVKKSFLYLLVSLLLLLFPVGVTAQSAPTCGNWQDVSLDDPDYNAFVHVCKLGYFIGNSSGNLRPNDTLTRVEAAVILNRTLGLKEVFDPSINKISFVDKYLVENLGNKDAQWVYDAVYNASSTDAFSGYDDKTFRPFNSIKFVEFSKVFLLAMQSANKSAYPEYEFSFDKDPWYRDIDSLLRDFDGASALIPKASSFDVNSKLGATNVNYSTDITRRQAILFVSALAEQGYLNGKVYYANSDLGLSFDYPVGFYSSPTDSGVNFLAGDGYVTRNGVQRITAGIYNGNSKPEGFVIPTPEKLAGTVEKIVKFESCDTSTGYCQIAYFIIDDESHTYFVEISYISRVSSSAQQFIDRILNSFQLRS